MESADREPEFESLLEFVRSERGFDFTGYKRPSLKRRFERRLGANHLADFAAYRAHLTEHPEEYAELFDTILINVTSFFRDPPMWKRLADEVLPRLRDAGERFGSIRVWSAGCSSGEEAYTIAMILAHELGPAEFRLRVKIYATDADEDALSAGRQAVYSHDAVAAVDDELRERYFDETNGGYIVRPELRRAVIFGRQDLLQDAPISRVDLLTARNTLMYFEPPSQAQIMRGFHFALRDEGTLFLGKSEVLMAQTHLFRAIDLKHRIFARVPVPNNGARLPLRPAPARDQVDGAELSGPAFDGTPVPQVIVSGDGRLALANQKARVLFGLVATDVHRPFQDLEISYRPTDLRSAIDRARDTRQTVHIPAVEWRTARGTEHVYDVRVTPLQAHDGELPGYSIAFLDVTNVKILQDAMDISRQQGANAFEELQATNEELETMNEELQSTNEQLEAINDLLEVRSGEARTANTYLHSVLGSLADGVAVIDREHIVTAWNQAAEELWGVRADGAIGRHVFSLDIGLALEQLGAPIREAIEGASPAPATLDATNRRGRPIGCEVTVTPLRSEDDSIQGAILFMRELSVS